MRKPLRVLSLLLGIGCMAAAGFLFVNTQQEEQVAQTVSYDVVQAFGTQVKLQNMSKPQVDLKPDVLLDIEEESKDELEQVPEEENLVAQPEEAPTVEIDGEQYIALLYIPWLGIELPIAQECTDANLARTPCAFYGSFAENNLVIAGHNYKAHFGGVNKLELDSLLILMDAAGEVYTYHLVAKEQVSGEDAVAILTGDWDLSLFTCVYGDNTKRDVLRYKLQEK